MADESNKNEFTEQASDVYEQVNAAASQSSDTVGDKPASGKPSSGETVSDAPAGGAEEATENSGSESESEEAPKKKKLPKQVIGSLISTLCVTIFFIAMMVFHASFHTSIMGYPDYYDSTPYKLIHPVAMEVEDIGAMYIGK